MSRNPLLDQTETILKEFLGTTFGNIYMSDSLNLQPVNKEKHHIANDRSPCKKTLEQEALLRAGITLAIPFNECR